MHAQPLQSKCRKPQARDVESGLRGTIFSVSMKFGDVVQKPRAVFALFFSGEFLFYWLDCDQKRGEYFFIVKIVLDFVRTFSLKC